MLKLRSKTVSETFLWLFAVALLANDAAFTENKKSILDQTGTEEDSILLEHKSGDAKGTVEFR